MARTFIFENGQYKACGNKIITNGNFIRVEGGSLTKGDALIATYSHQVEDGVVKNLYVNFNDMSEAAAVLSQINACFSALAADGGKTTEE